jgi:hypothetical protein
MTVVLNGIKNFLELINQNWTLITIVIGLGILAYARIKNYLSLSKEQKVDIALNQIRNVALKLVTDAEEEYENWVKSGSIKRSQFIKQIYKDYPILSKVADQETLLEKIDIIIDDALDEMRIVIEENTKVDEVM